MRGANKIYAVIDTNVLVSTLYSKNGTSNPGIIINQVLEGNIIPLINPIILKEYKDVLSRPKFAFPSQLVSDLYDAFVEFGIDTERCPMDSALFPDKDDMVFYEVKLTVDDSYLITGNIRHFPMNPLVVTPAQMVEILKEKGFLQP
ncbi:MAG: putative toxin-antitoxin system toxin component, PIN family [Muribaculaceae bacterium]|nr:putative toxin-antitoxin system toxin component, PIN family [Muribaculaceae bacterium]